ncbi:hypothetical protein BDW59DRAFT_163556 [Aspergillus cavernicola]|uniref:Ankyrin repeat-containing domain protein n=1 Tax=Aspergillus cavernicola TaxID=176166 RepID=A0ABR4I8B6_9EURO
MVNKDGMSVLQLAISSDSPEILVFVSTVDAVMQDINKLVDGITALHLSIAKRKPAAFELLVQAGADSCQPPVGGHALDLAIKVPRSNDYFVRRILELGKETLTLQDKNQALTKAVEASQWSLADYLMEQGADINGLRHPDGAPLGHHTVFGSVLRIQKIEKVAAALDHLIPLAAKHGQCPQFIVIPDLNGSAFHCVASEWFTHENYEVSRIRSILLEMFPGKDHLEVRETRGWTALHIAVAARNVVALRAFLDAGADPNSLTLINGIPAGPSAKDLLFSTLLERNPINDLSPKNRRDAEPVTLRAEQRQHASGAEREVMDFVEDISMRPHSLPRLLSHSMTDGFVESMAGGDTHTFNHAVSDIAKSIQWDGIEKVRFLRNEGLRMLRPIGLLEAYLDD